jgi:hypothetical protein
MAVTLHSVGFFGSGKVPPATATALLNKDLPQNLGAVIRPAEITRKMATLSAVVDWLEAEVGPDGVLPSGDLVADLLARQMEGDEIALIAILPDEPTETELATLKDARENDIRVKDLAKALDDVDWDVLFPPEPEPEVTEEPAPAVAASAVEAVAQGSPYATEQLLGGLAGYVTALVYKILREEGVPLSSDAARNVTGAVAPSALKAAAARAQAAKPGADAKPAARSPRTRAAKPAAKPAADASELPDDEPPFEGPYVGDDLQEASASAKTYKYYVNPDGAYRLARGLPRRGEEIASLTQAEIDELTEQGLITEPKSGSRQ